MGSVVDFPRLLFNELKCLWISSMADLSVWCYSCDYYVDNAKLYAAKNALHVNKFGEDMPRRLEPEVPPNLHLA